MTRLCFEERDLSICPYQAPKKIATGARHLQVCIGEKQPSRNIIKMQILAAKHVFHAPRSLHLHAEPSIGSASMLVKNSVEKNLRGAVSKSIRFHIGNKVRIYPQGHFLRMKIH